MLTLDANVWIAAYDRRDRYHEPSVQFLQAVTQQLQPLHGPSLLLIETSCALARRGRKPLVGQSALVRLRHHPLLKLHPVDDVLLTSAASLGTRLLLRGADALYAATAELTHSQLISWDAELIDRAQAITPTDRLSVNRQLLET